jgi:DNA primase
VLDALLGDEGYRAGSAQERAVRSVLEALATIADPLRRRVHVDDLAARTGLPAALLEEQLSSLRRREAELSRRSVERETASAGAAGAARPPSAARVTPGAAGKLPALERDFIAVLLHSENLGSEMLGDFGPDHFEHETTRRVVAAAVRIRSAGGSPSAGALLAEFAEDEATRTFLGRLSVTEHYQGELERRAADCRALLRRRPLEREMKTVMAEMRKAKARGETDRMRELGQRKLALRRELESLGSPKEVQ